MFIRALVNSLINDILNFATFWLIHGSRRLWNNLSDQLHSLEQIFGMRANLKHFLAPLYGDYSLPGYVFAVPWRLLLITLGILLAALVVILHTILFIAYLAAPVIISILYAYAPKF